MKFFRSEGKIEPYPLSTTDGLHIKRVEKMNDTYIKVRLSEELKEQALRTFESIGISASDAIRVFLTRTIPEQRIPFELKAARTPVFADNLEPEKLREEILKGKVAIDEGRYLPADEAFSQIRRNLDL